MEPLITTIIPTYRRPDLLSRAIRSVLGQTISQVQVMVLDNASGDDTARRVADISHQDSRVQYYCHRENIGSLRNFQYGLRQVRTPFFSFLSDDDLLLPDFYKTAIQQFNKYPVASFVCCAVLHFTLDGDYRGSPMSPWPEGIYHPPEGLLAMLRYGHPGWTGILFRRSILDQVGFLDLESGFVMDLDFVQRASAKTSFTVSRKPGGVYSTGLLTPQKEGTYPFDLVWPAWPHMIENLTKEALLPEPVKREVKRRLEDQFRNNLYLLTFRYLYQNKAADAQKAQKLLGREFKRRFQAGILQMAIALHKMLGEKKAFAFWSFCLAAKRLFKSALTSRKKEIAILPDGSDAAAFLPFLEIFGRSKSRTLDHMSDILKSSQV